MRNPSIFKLEIFYSIIPESITNWIGFVIVEILKYPRVPCFLAFLLAKF